MCRARRGSTAPGSGVGAGLVATRLAARQSSPATWRFLRRWPCLPAGSSRSYRVHRGWQDRIAGGHTNRPSRLVRMLPRAVCLPLGAIAPHPLGSMRRPGSVGVSVASSHWRPPGVFWSKSNTLRSLHSRGRLSGARGGLLIRAGFCETDASLGPYCVHLGNDVKRSVWVLANQRTSPSL